MSGFRSRTDHQLLEAQCVPQQAAVISPMLVANWRRYTQCSRTGVENRTTSHSRPERQVKNILGTKHLGVLSELREHVSSRWAIRPRPGRICGKKARKKRSLHRERIRPWATRRRSGRVRPGSLRLPLRDRCNSAASTLGPKESSNGGGQSRELSEAELQFHIDGIQCSAV
jgi:hypothetical protein